MKETTTMTKRQIKALDTQIERIFYANCSGIQLNVLDIGKVFAAGRAAADKGESIEAAVLTSVAALRVN
jgi:hypothetical protein